MYMYKKFQMHSKLKFCFKVIRFKISIVTVNCMNASTIRDLHYDYICLSGIS